MNQTFHSFRLSLVHLEVLYRRWLCGTYGRRTEIELAMLTSIGRPATPPRYDEPSSAPWTAKPSEREPRESRADPARQNAGDQRNDQNAADGRIEKRAEQSGADEESYEAEEEPPVPSPQAGVPPCGVGQALVVAVAHDVRRVTRIGRLIVNRRL